MSDGLFEKPATTTWQTAEEREVRMRADAYKQIRGKLPMRFHCRDAAPYGEPAELASRARPPEEVTAAMKWLVVGAPPSIVIGGSAGSGKTSLAAALFLSLARVEVERPSAVLDYAVNGFVYLSAYELALDRASSPMGREPPLVGHAQRAYVLLIDDLGTEPVHVDTVGTLLRRGDSTILRTIVTTSRGPSELVERYGEGVARRLLAEGYGMYVPLHGARE